ADGEHQVRAVHAVDASESSKAADPDQRHAIGRDQASAVMDVLQLRVPLALHHPMDAGDADIMTLPVVDPLADRLERDRRVDGAHADAEHVTTPNQWRSPVLIPGR